MKPNLKDIYKIIDSATHPTDTSRATANSIKEALKGFEKELQELQDKGCPVCHGLHCGKHYLREILGET